MKATSVPCVPSQERLVTAQGGRGGKGKEFDQIKGGKTPCNSIQKI